MPKGMLTQGLCVLLQLAVSLDEMEAVLGEFDILKRIDESTDWVFGGPTLVVAYRPEVNGLVAVDIVDRPWPDDMGSPEADAMLFGAADDKPVMPDDYEALPELEFVTKLTSALLELPGALCYFNPGGEMLRDQDGLRELLNFGWSNDLPPLDAWSNVRLFNINEEWSMMDTVGNGQLDIPDVEACFHTESYEFGHIDNFLRNVSLYLLKNGEVINDGDTMNGPGDEVWQANHIEDSLCDPPRSVLRWVPMDDRPVPPEISGDEE